MTLPLPVRSRPVEAEAHRWLGPSGVSPDELREWGCPTKEHFALNFNVGTFERRDNCSISVLTPNGEVAVPVGHWIVRWGPRKFYVYSNEEFEQGFVLTKFPRLPPIRARIVGFLVRSA